MFKRGDRVLCIDDSLPEPPSVRHSFSTWIESGTIYTIRECIFTQITNKWGVALKEIKNPAVYIPDLDCKVEPMYNAERFVKMDKQDEEFIAELQEINFNEQ